MKNILTLLYLFSLALTAHGQQVLDRGYFFFTEEGFNKIEQKNDTLYTYRCLKDLSCPSKPNRHFKLLSTEKLADYVVLKLERLDSIPLTQDPYPKDRFSVLAFKAINNKSLSYILEAKRYTRDEIDTLNVKQSDLDGKFSFTYYSQEYLVELAKLKPISTRKEIEDILLLFERPEYKRIIQMHKDSGVIDMYGLGLMSELWYKAVIESGYNPHGSREKFNQLMR